MYRYICFDLDGTLTQSEYGIIRAAKYALGKMGIIEDDRSRLLRFIGPPLYVSFAEYYGMSEEDTEHAIRLYRGIYDSEAYKEAPLYEGVEEVLARLKDNDRRIYIVTSKPSHMAVKVCEHTGIEKYSEAIIGPDSEMKDPSKARLLQKAVAHIGNPDISEMLMIGDRHYDVEGANEVGIDSVGVLYGYGSREELERVGATYIVNSSQEILELILAPEV